MAKAAVQERGSTSSAVRTYFDANPNASVQEAIDGLRSLGIEASKALVGKIKYSERRTVGRVKRGRKKKVAAARRTTTADGSAGQAEGETKADSIRAAFGELGRRTRPKVVIAHLADKGIRVSSSQVTAVRKSLKGRGGRKAKVPTAAAAQNGTRDQESISVHSLLEAKKAADRLGGLDELRRAVSALAKLS